MKLQITINGHSREFSESESVKTISDLVAKLDLKADRVAVERNGELAARATWHLAELQQGDRLELVHFVGGGSKSECNS
jgi:sulfur carrier protein